MIENKNKKRVNCGEFLQGGEPPLIGRARSSQKTSPFYDLFFVGNDFVFFKPTLPLCFFNLSCLFFSLPILPLL